MPQWLGFSSSFSVKIILLLQGPAQMMSSRNISWSFRSGIIIHFAHFILSPWIMLVPTFSKWFIFYIIVSGLNFKFIESTVCVLLISVCPKWLTDEWRNKLVHDLESAYTSSFFLLCDNWNEVLLIFHIQYFIHVPSSLYFSAIFYIQPLLSNLTQQICFSWYMFILSLSHCIKDASFDSMTLPSKYCSRPSYHVKHPGYCHPTSPASGSSGSHNLGT